MSSIPASDKLRPDDFSEAHELPVDIIGTHKQYRNLQDNVYGYIHEVTQNMFDSNDNGKPNKLQIRIGTKPNEPVLWCKDEGPMGITKEYGGDIDAFIADMKATTEKILRGLNRKGIGMFQYTNIAPKVVITSMDQEMIYRIPMWITPEGATAYGKISKKPAMLEKYKEQFGIYKSGTIVAFHERDPTDPKIDEKELIKSTREKWALRLFDEEKIEFTIGQKRMEPPQYIIDHPPIGLQKMTGGAPIRGNIWLDEKGVGRIKVFQDGYLVEEINTEPRQCTGYVECSSLGTDTGRTKFLKDNRRWDEFKSRIQRETTRFPRIAPEIQDVKNILKVRDLAQKILKLPKAPTAYGKTPDLEKIEATGDRNGDEIIGYPLSPPPEEGREIIPRPGGIGIKHDMNNQTTVGEEGNDQIKKTGTEIKGPRSNHNSLEYQDNQHQGYDRPLFILMRDRKPFLLLENADNAEHAIYEMLKANPTTGVMVKMYNCKMLDWLSEINLETDELIDEPMRMRLSNARVGAWKMGGYMPNKKVITAAAKGGPNRN